MDITSIEHHIRTLDNQHNALDIKINSIMRLPSWNEFEVEQLKKEKLILKDKLAHFYKLRYDLMNEVHFD
jgi:hypothetical protein